MQFSVKTVAANKEGPHQNIIGCLDQVFFCDFLI